MSVLIEVVVAIVGLMLVRERNHVLMFFGAILLLISAFMFATHWKV